MAERPNHPPHGSIALVPDVDHPPTDPLVVQRLVDSADPKTQIVTEFRAAHARPASYPAGFPHLPGRSVWTTESPNGRVGPGARWFCTDPDAVVDEVQQALLDAGWVSVSPPDLGPVSVRMAFAQSELMRLVVVGGRDDSLGVQLLEVSAKIFAGGSA